MKPVKRSSKVAQVEAQDTRQLTEEGASSGRGQMSTDSLRVKKLKIYEDALALLESIRGQSQELIKQQLNLVVSKDTSVSVMKKSSVDPTPRHEEEEPSASAKVDMQEHLPQKDDEEGKSPLL